MVKIFHSQSSILLVSHCVFFLIIFYYLCYYSCPNFFPFVPLYPTPSDNPHTIVHVHGSCIFVLWLLYSLCYTLHSHEYSVTTNLYFLIPSPSSPITTIPLPSSIHRNVLCIYESISVLLVHVFYFFLDLIVDRYEFICHFTVHILIFFFFLKKTL